MAAAQPRPARSEHSEIHDALYRGVVLCKDGMPPLAALGWFALLCTAADQPRILAFTLCSGLRAHAPIHTRLAVHGSAAFVTACILTLADVSHSRATL